jgi:carbonic anhydrase/acetyltransferase-like protein (isoleucine patch superfamily)
MAAAQLVVYGAGHLGRQVYHHLRHHAAPGTTVLGFVDDVRPAGEIVIDGRLTLGSLAQVEASRADDPSPLQLVFAIGYGDMAARARALDRVLAGEWTLHTVVHPRAVVEPGARLGRGCIVLAQAVVDQDVQVGDGCFLDIGVRLTAGTVIGRNNYLSSGTSTGSRVHIGDHCFFGMDCTVTTDVRMGSNLFVNAKTLVPRDVGDNLKLVELHKSRELPHASPPPSDP